MKSFFNVFQNLIIVFIFSIAFLTSFKVTIGAPQCPSNDQEVDSTQCPHGTFTNWCNQLQCAKGPGESCGGSWLEHGRCGGGMYCACGLCSGCSATTFKCHSVEFCQESPEF